MVFPLYDDNSDRLTTPVVNYAIIAVNILVFVFLQQLGTNEQFTYAFSTVPLEILTGHDVVTPTRVLIEPVTGQRMLVPGLERTPFSVYLTLFTSMFMHGGIAHIAGTALGAFGSAQGGIPASMVAPSLLFDELEVRGARGEAKRLPLMPPPPMTVTK